MRVTKKMLMLVLLCCLFPAIAAAERTYELITVGYSGEQANGAAYNPAISDNGRYVAFASKASNLVPNDTNNMDDVFLFDRKTKIIERVSLIDGKPSANQTFVGISGDGTVIAYNIYLPNESTWAIFVYDTKTKTTERILPTTWGGIIRPVLNVDGRYVVYLLGWDAQLYMYDRLNKTTELITKSSSGVMSNARNNQEPGRISQDGRYVSFSSFGSNLVPNDTNGWADIFVHDRLTHQTERISVDSDGNQYPLGLGGALGFSNSSDFRYFTFLPAGATTMKIKDRATGIVSDLPDVSFFSTVNADGRYIQYSWRDIGSYIYDRTTGESELIISGNAATVMNADASVFALATDQALNSSDTNGIGDIYVYARLIPDTTPPQTRYQLSGTPGQNGWFVSDVLVTLTATDDKSGVKDIVSVLNNGTPTVHEGAGGSLTISSEGPNTLAYYSEDNADPSNKDSNPPVAINIDKTAPTITASVSPAPNRAGWYNTNATVTFACSDATSGIAECLPPVTLSQDGAWQIVSGKAVDNAGNRAETSVTLNIDTTPPAIVIKGVQEGAKYPLGLVPTASYTVSDSLSGVASSSDALTGGDGLGLGTFSYKVAASDVAGNTATIIVSYEVIATPEGLIALIRQMLASGKIDNAGIANSLISKVQNAQKANGNVADNIMQAFINQVEAQSGKHIASDAAAILIHAAEYIINY